jgi:hypothetical protein
MHAADFLASPSGKKLSELFPSPPESDELMKKLGLVDSDLLEIAGMLREIPPNPADEQPGKQLRSQLGVFFVASLAKPMDPVKIEAIEGVSKKDVGGKTIYTVKVDTKGNLPRDEIAIQLLTPKLMIFGTEPAILAASTTKSDGLMGPLLAEARSSKHILYVGFKTPPEFAEMAKQAPPAAASFLPLAKLNRGMVKLSEDGGKLSLAIRMYFADAMKAEAAKTAVDGLSALIAIMLPNVTKGMPPEQQKIATDAAKSIKAKQNGSDVDVAAHANTTIGALAEVLTPMLKGAANAEVAVNNMKQIAVAMHNHHDAAGAFPLAKIGGGLSWRVAVLPYVEQDNLFREFNLAEPWNSEHNMKLLEKMPKVFEHPTRKAPKGYTFYRVFHGKEAMFHAGRALKMQDIADGTSNTLMIVEAETAVPWTKSEELEFNPKGELPKLGDPAKGGEFLAALADGSVRVIRMVPPDILRALITIAGAELVDWDKVK